MSVTVTYRYVMSGGAPQVLPTYLDAAGNVISEGKIEPIEEILVDEAEYKARLLVFQQSKADSAAVELARMRAEGDAGGQQDAKEQVRDEALALGFSAAAAATIAGLLPPGKR